MDTVRLTIIVLMTLALGISGERCVCSVEANDQATRPENSNRGVVDPQKSTIQITREAECRWTDKPPILDGVLDDPCWKAAQPIKHFASFWEQTQRSGTTAYLVWDQDAIYYGGIMKDRELRAFGVNRNESLWNGDVFEVFFKPRRESPEYFEFQANPREAVFEVAFPARGKITGDYPKQPILGTQAVVKMIGTLDRPGDTDTSWTVEGRIPWSAFAIAGGRPKPGKVWSFAICRYDYGPEGTEPVLMSSAPLTKMNFHHYEDYGNLRFIGPQR
jgi:hypothetical protein